MKNFKRLIPSLMLGIIFSIVIAFNAFAMGISISFSDVNARVGDEVNLIMTLSADGGEIESANIMLSYDDAALEFVSGTNAQGGAGSVKITSNTGTDSTSQNFSLKFKAKAQGDTTIVVSTWEVYDKDAQMATMQSQGSGRVKIEEAPPSSGDLDNPSESETVATNKKDALLASLQVSPGKLVPEFNSEIKNYDMNVGANTSNISVNAKARQDGAKVIITGNDNLVVGINAITVKVTAPDGSTVQSYIINVNKSESNSVSNETTLAENSDETVPPPVLDIVSTSNGLTLGGIDYQVSDSFDNKTLPEGFEETTFNYKGREVKAGKMKDQEVYILYLVGNDGSGDFYIYNEASDIWSVYTQISISQRTITIMPKDEGIEVPRGFVESIIDINGKKIRGWIWGSDNEKRYCVVYAMNSDGRKDFYRYDIEERTIQRYFVDPNADTGFTTDEYNTLQKKYDDLKSMSRNIIYLLIIIILILTFVLFGVSVSNRNKKAPSPKRVSKKRPGANISTKVNLINEEEMDDENPLEYMPLSQKKEEESKEIDDSPEFDDFDEVDLSSDENDAWEDTDTSHDFEDLDI